MNNPLPKPSQSLAIRSPAVRETGLIATRAQQTHPKHGHASPVHLCTLVWAGRISVCLLETSAARGRSPLDLALRPRPLLNQTPKLGGIFFPCFLAFYFFWKRKKYFFPPFFFFFFLFSERPTIGDKDLRIGWVKPFSNSVCSVHTREVPCYGPTRFRDLRTAWLQNAKERRRVQSSN